MWIILGVCAVFAVCYVLVTKKRAFLKKHGIKVTGTVIEVTEVAPVRNDGPGGIIYSPVVSFTTIDGLAITGRPVTGFVSQVKIIAPFRVNVFYNPNKPGKFYIEV